MLDLFVRRRLSRARKNWAGCERVREAGWVAREEGWSWEGTRDGEGGVQEWVRLDSAKRAEDQGMRFNRRRERELDDEESRDGELDSLRTT